MPVSVCATAAPIRFPLHLSCGGRQDRFAIWRGEQLPDALLAYDTETAPIEGREIPQLALATVWGDAGSGFFVHPQDVSRFVHQHANACWCCHNATFDFWVTAQALQSDAQACALWWDIADAGRLCCTMLLDALIRLAKTDENPVYRDLGTVAAEYCGLQFDKSDPYRLRYGELLNLSAEDWSRTEPGFWQYAARDPIATLQVAKRQCQIAQELIGPVTGQLFSDAVKRFGPLTACLQVQGAIALDYISRVGIAVDLPQAKRLHGDLETLVEEARLELERLGGAGLFKRYGPRSKHAGQLQRTPAGVPKRNAKAIKKRLGEIADAASIHPTTLKDGSCTDAVQYWAQHQDIDPFVRAYVEFSRQAKLAQFLRDLKHDRIYPRYNPLVRTGRTSCSKPNLQQLPRDARFREMIVAPPGNRLLQIDFSVLELRTLAQICLMRYGKSVLAGLFHQEVDPHCYTAALLLGMTLEAFNQLSSGEQKKT